MSQMTDEDMSMLPPPPVLTRQDALDGHMMVQPDPEMTTRYLQYECRYKNCKYQDPKLTWGELVKQDYNHFVDLMCYDVPRDSNTFLALAQELKSGDMEKAMSTTRHRDTTEGKEKTCDEYLSFKCMHKGRMNGKTWRDVRNKDYSYFVWAVGNTMSRDTKTFRVFRDCLKENEQKMVDSHDKGQVKVPKGLKWSV